MKNLSKWAKVGIIIGIIAVVLASVLLIYYFGNTHKNFYSIATKEFEIPGLKDGMTPQGLCYIDSKEKYLVSGYMKDGSDSRIYVIDKKTKLSEKYFTIKGSDEKISKYHLGGVASNDKYVWIATDTYLLTLNLSDVINVENGKSVNVIDIFNTGTGADFCFTNNDCLYVGDFYRKKNYETDESHHVKISNTETNRAIALCFNFNDANPNGLDSKPNKAVSLPDQVQGMVLTDSNKIVLSTSYSLPDSKIYVYKNVLDTPTTNTITLGENSIPLYILSNDTLDKTIKAPSMSEGLDYVDGKVTILFESACNKYKMFTRNRVKYVYSIKVD